MRLFFLTHLLAQQVYLGTSFSAQNPKITKMTIYFLHLDCSHGNRDRARRFSCSQPADGLVFHEHCSDRLRGHLLTTLWQFSGRKKLQILAHICGLSNAILGGIKSHILMFDSFAQKCATFSVVAPLSPHLKRSGWGVAGGASPCLIDSL